MRATAVARRYVGLCVLFAVLLPAAVSASQDVDAQEAWAPERLRHWTTESLLDTLKRLQRIVSTYPDLAPYGRESNRGTGAERAWQAYIETCRGHMEAVRAALIARNIRPPGIRVVSAGSAGAAGGSGNTGSTARPVRPNTGTSTTRTAKPPASGQPVAGPAAVFLTAGELARCGTDGVSLADCAAAFVRRAAWQIPLGVAVAALSPTGAVIGTVWALGSTAGYIAIALSQASANYDLMSQQRANAERVSPARMDAIVSTLVSRFKDVALPALTENDLELDAHALRLVIARARREFDAFERGNRTTKLASQACADPQQLPAERVAFADRQLARMVPLSDTISSTLAEARRLVESCTGPADAQRARELYAKAQADMAALEEMSRTATGALGDVVRFLATVRAARTSLQDAARHKAALDGLQTEVDAAKEKIDLKILEATDQIDARSEAMGAVFMEVMNLRGAFPSTPPPHIAGGFQRIDSAYAAEASRGLRPSRADAISSAAATEWARYGTWRERADADFDDLRACGQITGELPEPLKRDLARLGNDISATFRRAQQAMSGASDIPAKADACARRFTNPPAEGRLSGQCQGSITVSPLEGAPGSPLLVNVTIDPPGAQRVTRVAVENPGCDSPACRDMRLVRLGAYQLPLTFRAPTGAPSADGVLGRFRLNVTAYEGERPLCTGQSPLLTVKGQHP